MDYEQIKKIIEEQIVFTNVRNLDKKASRATFEVGVGIEGLKKKYYIELWAEQAFLKMYEGPHRAFFAEEIFTELVGEELTQETLVLANDCFTQKITELVLQSDVYQKKKEENPEFKL